MEYKEKQYYAMHPNMNDDIALKFKESCTIIATKKLTLMRREPSLI